MEPENRFFLEETGAQQSLTKKLLAVLYFVHTQLSQFKRLQLVWTKYNMQSSDDFLVIDC